MRRLTWLLVACGFSAPLGVAHAETVEEKSVGFIEKMADVVDANKGSCDAMADALEKHFTDNASLVKEMKELDKSQTRDQKLAYSKKYKDRLTRAKKKAGGAMAKCHDNKKLAAIMKQF